MRWPGRMDARRRVRGGQRVSVGELAAAEPLRPVPAVPFPAELAAACTVTPQALVGLPRHSYSVPPGLGVATVTVTHRLGSAEVAIVTASSAVIALWVPDIRPQAACAYSWISPPSRSRRATLPAGTTTAGSLGPSGGACPKARCGRCTL
jgi:hypothetical protein